MTKALLSGSVLMIYKKRLVGSRGYLLLDMGKLIILARLLIHTLPKELS